MQEVFEKIINELESEAERWEDSGKEYNDKCEISVGRGFRNAIKIVKKVADEYNNGWISCSVVDHPEHCNECEVTMLDTHGYTRDIAFYTDKWRRASDEAAVTVVAWKEPSLPYQPKGE